MDFGVAAVTPYIKLVTHCLEEMMMPMLPAVVIWASSHQVCHTL